jgi:hypothetical protein
MIVTTPPVLQDSLSSGNEHISSGPKNSFRSPQAAVHALCGKSKGAALGRLVGWLSSSSLASPEHSPTEFANSQTALAHLDLSENAANPCKPQKLMAISTNMIMKQWICGSLFFGCRKPICGPFAIWMMMGIPAFMTFMG